MSSVLPNTLVSDAGVRERANSAGGEAAVSSSPSLVNVTCVHLKLDLLSSGRMNRWMGSSLRGVLAKPLKDRWCVWDAITRDQQYEHCDGCIHQAGCGYARLLEPAQQDTNVKGWFAAPHRLALVPQYPMPTWIESGSTQHQRENTLRLRLIFLETPMAEIEQVIQQLARCGDHHGLGKDQIRFGVDLDTDSGAAVRNWNWLDRWMHVVNKPQATNERVRTLRVTALTPMLLKREGDNVREPHFFDLIAAAQRLCRALLDDVTAYEARLSLSEAENLKHMASGVIAGQQRWQEVTHHRNSRRTGQRYQCEGLYGWAEYQNVPSILAHLLHFAGELGIGSNRVSGNGQLRVTV